MKQTQTAVAQTTSRENKSGNALRTFQKKLEANKVETNVPFSASEVQEHTEKNLGSWKLTSGELPNRKVRRMKKPPAVKARAVPEQETRSKQERRIHAITLLEKQLENGTKPAKMHYSRFYGNGLPEGGQMVGILPEGAEKVGDLIKLTQIEKARIQEQINNLQRKIDNRKQREHTLMVMNTIDLQDRWPTEPVKVKSGNPMRPKNPKTKLYRFIAGVYKKITK